MTKGCSRGELPGCGCDKSKVGNAGSFEWAGCSDNVLYGTAFSKRFTDARERLKKSNGRSLMNLHNNQAGRQVRQQPSVNLSVSPSARQRRITRCQAAHSLIELSGSWLPGSPYPSVISGYDVAVRCCSAMLRYDVAIRCCDTMLRYDVAIRYHVGPDGRHTCGSFLT